MKRRDFIKATAAASMLGMGALTACGRGNKRLFKISLAEWSLYRSLFSGTVDHLDLAKIAKETFQIEGIEYVNQFFMDKAEDKSYLGEMHKRCTDYGVQSVLIMCDNEGRIGDPSDAARIQAVENHYKWVQAAQFLGCHSIRVNAYSQGGPDEQQKLVADGLHRLCEYADDYDINILVENHGGLSSNGKWLSAVMKMVDHPRIGTLPDFGNFRLGKDEWYDRYQGVKELMPFAKGVSAKSSEFDADGEEIRTDYLRMMKIVLDAGYHGFVGIEYSGPTLPEMEGIAATKKLLERVHETLVG